MDEQEERFSGYCADCGREHFLDTGKAKPYALELMEQLDREKRIDLPPAGSGADDRFLTRSLFGDARGKMFGVLLCHDSQGREVVLQGFSGQFNGTWEVPGWVGPLFSVQAFHHLQDERERRIKELGQKMELHPVGSAEYITSKHQRRRLSRELMADIFSLYRVPDFRGRIRSLWEVFLGKEGIPTGTGDCCAPKLLAHAALNGLVPVSLSEFYYGRDNASGSCAHKGFYPPCSSRCRPILGAMLCGLGEM